LLDVYYTSKEVGCQVNFNHRFHRFSQILWIELPAKETEDTEKKKFEILSTKSETNSKPKCSNEQNEKEPRITRIARIIRIWA